MVDDHEIWRSAQKMIDRFGDKALREIDKRIQELHQAGETEACSTWQRIRETANVILNAVDRKRKH